MPAKDPLYLETVFVVFRFRMLPDEQQYNDDYYYDYEYEKNQDYADLVYQDEQEQYNYQYDYDYNEMYFNKNNMHSK